MKRRSFYPLLAIVLLIVAQLACDSSDNSGEKVDATGAPQPTRATFGVGDVVAVGEHTITLESATLEGDVLQATFVIENQGADEMNVSSLLSFSARGADGTKLEGAFFDCGPDLGGKVLAGDKLKGDVCWKGAAYPVKVYYEAELFGSGAVVWEIKE